MPTSRNTCQSGSFLWRFRKGVITEAQFAAGSKFEILMDALAGARQKRAPGETTHKGQFRGLGASSQALAHSDLTNLCKIIGRHSFSRIYAHVVEGKTVSELSDALGIDGRDLSAILKSDLDALADALNLHSSGSSRYAHSVASRLQITA